jgi:hypothetical protein
MASETYEYLKELSYLYNSSLIYGGVFGFDRYWLKTKGTWGLN